MFASPMNNKRITYTLAFALAFVVVGAHAQDEEPTEEQIDRQAMEQTMSAMAESLPPERLAFMASMMFQLSEDELYEEYVELPVSMPGREYQAWNGSFTDPQFDYTNIEEPITGGWANAIVALIYCEMNAHNPHAGSGPNGVRMVKAKSDGECHIVPTGQGAPPAPSTVDWSLNMALMKRQWVVLGPINGYYYLPVGWASHERDGTWNPEWEQNPSGGHDGTQVFHGFGSCSNGSYRNVSSLWIDLPWPFSTPTFGFLGLRIKTASVTSC